MFRHYWVLVKFALAIGATILLLLHQFTAVAGAARRVSGAAPGTLPEVGRRGAQLVGDAGLAVLVLLVTTTLSVYKPWGRTRYGQRKQQQEQRKEQEHESLQILGGTPISTPPTLPDPDNETAADGLPLRLKILLAVIGVIVVGFVVLHLTGGALRATVCDPGGPWRQPLYVGRARVQNYSDLHS